MGKTYSLPCYAVDISGISELECRLEVLRTSGEWDEQDLCQDPSKYEAGYGTDEGKAVPAATKIMVGHKGPATIPDWRIFMTKYSRDHPEAICGWRNINKIRPVGMSEEEAQEWRKKVESEIEKLATENRNCAQ
jgi:hypothetical protein